MFRERFSALLGQLVDVCVALQLVVVEDGGLHLLLRDDLTDRLVQLLRDRSGSVLVLRLSDLGADLVEKGDQLLVDLIARVDRIHHGLLRDLIGAGLDHDDLFRGARDGQREV